MSDETGLVMFRPIGRIRTAFTNIEGMPIQASAAVGHEGRIELDPALAPGLLDLDGFSHLLLIYHLDRVRTPALVVTPFLDDRPYGIFATRSPARPNAIGLSTVQLLRIDGATLHIADVDILDDTPLLDMKPYVPAFDDRPDARIGWFERGLDRLPSTVADRRLDR